MLKETKRKLTEEERQKIISVLDDFISEYLPDENPESEYITEYDILMEKKIEEWKMHFLEDNEPSDIKSLMEMCDNYLKEKNEPDKFAATTFVLIMQYDMWLNNSPGWPVMYNPEWEEWEKLKEIKVKRRK